jgi:hypothetical protein
MNQHLRRAWASRPIGPHDYILPLRLYAEWCKSGVMLRLLRAGKSARVYPGYDRDPWARPKGRA